MIQFIIKFFGEDKTLFEKIDLFKVWGTNCKSQGELVNSLCEILKVMNGDMNKLVIELQAYYKDPFIASYNFKRKIGKTSKQAQGKLSEREIEVLNLIMQGHTNKEISEILFLSHETIRSHRKNILRKTNQKNTAALINYYHQTFFDK